MSVPEFISAKVLRYLLNDLFAICMIHGLFRDKSFTRFSFLVMGFGLVVLLPLYFFLYLSAVPGYSSMISHLHRLVLNPVLMMLLIPALWHQRRSERQR
jgi:exosortase F-associated protein